MVLALVDDLMFLSRIREAARPAGVDVKAVRNVADLVTACEATPPGLVILDLDSPRVPGIEALAKLKDAGLPGCPVVGFLGHEHTERMAEARAAGCTDVYARGAFVRALPELMQAAAPGATSGE